MKVIKLDRRHNLYRKGFTHALRFNNWDTTVNNFEKVLQNKYPVNSSNWRNSMWETHWGKAVRTSRGGRSRPYWIGVKNEAILTQVLLSV